MGVQEQSSFTQVQQGAEAKGVPSEALHLVVRQRPVPRLTLQQYVRPVEAGFKISSSAGICSLGFNAYKRNTLQRVFVTASHCSDEWYGSNPDSTVMYQPDDDPSSNRIGMEVADVTWYNCGHGEDPCRLSDASRFQYDSTVSFNVGYLAITESYGEGQSGSLVYDTAYAIVADHEDTYGTPVVHKTGQSSGWTKGEIIETCEIVPAPDEYPDRNFGCMDVAELMSKAGDSGGPVFKVVDSYKAQLIGIVYGGPPNDSTITYISPLANIQTELGSGGQLDVCAYYQGRCHPPTLSAWIDGPSEVIPGSPWCIWTASVTGGFSPYSYEWSGVKTGTQYYVAGAPYSSGYLILEVWSIDGQYTITDLYVTATEQAASCL